MKALFILTSFVFLMTFSAYKLYTGTRHHTLIWLQMIKAEPSISLINNNSILLPRYAMRKRGLCCRPMSVRLSVRPSVTLVDCIQTTEDTVKLLVHPGSPVTLVFWPHAPSLSSKGTPSAGAQSTMGLEIMRFSTEIAVYLDNGTR